MQDQEMVKNAVKLLRIKLKEDSSSCFKNNICDLPYSCTYTDSCQAYEMTLEPGLYRFEAWGAKGGDGYFSNVLRPGGTGGYSRGDITITRSRKVYAAIGGSGLSLQSSSRADGGFNRGGYNSDSRSDYRKSSGGGSTDFRLDVNNLDHRILVAGGGGGGNGASSGGAANGGVGCGSTGGKSPGRHSFSEDWSQADGNGGTQSTGGSRGSIVINVPQNTASQIDGIFGYGGNVEGDNVMAGPGGGGWFGGASGISHSGAGGGGSGFTLNESTAVNAPSSYSLKESKEDFLVNCLTIDGAHQFLSPTNQTVTGNNGNGFARITRLSDINPKKLCFLTNGKCYATPYLKHFVSIFASQSMS